MAVSFQCDGMEWINGRNFMRNKRLRRFCIDAGGQ